METDPRNPADNRLGSWITEADVVKGIDKSGYPLQTTVASYLRPKFDVQEEWSYFDGETEGFRSIDMRAVRHLFDWDEVELRARPVLALLIECKQSELPYVFFETQSAPWLQHFPPLAGLFSDKIAIATDDSRSTWQLTLCTALGFELHEFVKSQVKYSTTFSKFVRSGKSLKLSGSEPYNAVVLPIRKAMTHFEKSQRPPKTAQYFDCHIVMGVAVLNAPMLLAKVGEGGTEVAMTPWTRVLRHETTEEPGKWDSARWAAIDVVHRSFLPAYVSDYLLPFAEFCSKRIKDHQPEVASGKGFVSGMSKTRPQDVWSKLKPNKRPPAVTTAGISRSRS